VFKPDDAGQLEDAFREIAQDLRSGYTIGYVSNHRHTGGEYHAIRVVAGGRPGVKLNVRTRAGYISPKEMYDASR
jgi:hypothetical protein